jgi:hypothetical protein
MQLCWTLDVGRWTLDVGTLGRWTLDVGRWDVDMNCPIVHGSAHARQEL